MQLGRHLLELVFVPLGAKPSNIRMLSTLTQSKKQHLSNLQQKIESDLIQCLLPQCKELQPSTLHPLKHQRPEYLLPQRRQCALRQTTQHNRPFPREDYGTVEYHRCQFLTISFLAHAKGICSILFISFPTERANFLNPVPGSQSGKNRT